jgi:Polyketide cyclase / dehydrase and lipid transport
MPHPMHRDISSIAGDLVVGFLSLVYCFERMKLTHSIDIHASPQIVWEIWSDIERWSEWTASITKIQKLAPGPLAIGLRACVRQPKLPVAIWRVTQVEENRGFTWVSTSLGAQVTGIHTLEPCADGTRATMTLIFAGPLALLFGWLSRSLTQRYLQLEANGLKARSEQIAIVCK